MLLCAPVFAERLMAAGLPDVVQSRYVRQNGHGSWLGWPRERFKAVAS